jgi:hypothetical protein
VVEELELELSTGFCFGKVKDAMRIDQIVFDA